MTVDETLKLIAQQWCNLSDLMKLANIERNSALANIISCFENKVSTFLF